MEELRERSIYLTFPIFIRIFRCGGGSEAQRTGANKRGVLSQNCGVLCQ